MKAVPDTHAFGPHTGTDLSDLIQRMTCCHAYLDSTDLVDLRTLFNQGVHKTDVMVVLATKDVFTRPWCLMEMWEAAMHQVPVVLLPVAGKGFELEATVELLSDLNVHMRPRNPTCVVEVMEHVGKQGVTDVREVEDVLLAHLGLVPTLERTGRAEPGRVCAHLQRNGPEQLDRWLVAHHEAVKQRLGVLLWQAWDTDNQIIATVETLIDECALALGRERPEWKENVVMDDHKGALERRLSKVVRRLSRPGIKEDRGRVLIIAAGEECGGSVRMVQEQLGKLLQCEVVLGTGYVDTWRSEVAGATEGVILLQTASVLRHPIRLLQLFEANRQQYPIVCVNVVGAGYDFATVTPLLTSLWTELSQEDMEILRTELLVDGQGVGKLSSSLGRAVPNAISVFFNQGGGAAAVDAAIKDIVLKMGRTAELRRAAHNPETQSAVLRGRKVGGAAGVEAEGV